LILSFLTLKFNLLLFVRFSRTGSAGKEGHYGNGVNLADTKGHKNDYGRQEHYDRRQDHGQRAAQQQGKQLGGYYDDGSRHRAAAGGAGYYGGATGASAGAGSLGFHSAPAPYPYY
jgi:hypothetical protein